MEQLSSLLTILYMFKLLVALTLLVPFFSLGQNNTQSIRGTITDKLTQMPIIGATIQVSNQNIACVSDTFGNYALKNLAPERYELNVVFVGYKTMILPNIEVTSGKEVILDLSMEEEFKQLKGVVVTASTKGGTINKLATVSARTFSMEESQPLCWRKK